jgi:hypothetical protein
MKISNAERNVKNPLNRIQTHNNSPAVKITDSGNR